MIGFNSNFGLLKCFIVSKNCTTKSDFCGSLLTYLLNKLRDKFRFWVNGSINYDFEYRNRLGIGDWETKLQFFIWMGFS